METLSRVRTCMKVLNAIGRTRSLPGCPQRPLLPPASSGWIGARESGDLGEGAVCYSLCACSPAGGEGTTEDEIVGWHHRLDGHGFGWIPGIGDEQGGLASCGSWGRKESDTTEGLN